LGWILGGGDGPELRVVSVHGQRASRWWHEYTLELERYRACEHIQLPALITYGLLKPVESDQFGLGAVSLPFIALKPVTLPHSLPDKIGWAAWLDRVLSRMKGLAHAHSRGVIHGGLGANGLWDGCSGLRYSLWHAALKRAPDIWFAPEQDSQEGRFGRRADIYGLGLAVRQVFFRSAKRGDFPHAQCLERWVQRCLEPDPKVRWQTMAHAISGLSHVVQQLSQHSTQPAGQFRALLLGREVSKMGKQDGELPFEGPLVPTALPSTMTPGGVGEEMPAKAAALWETLQRFISGNRQKTVWIHGGSASMRTGLADWFCSRAQAEAAVDWWMADWTDRPVPGVALGRIFGRHWSLLGESIETIERVVAQKMCRLGMIDKSDHRVVVDLVLHSSSWVEVAPETLLASGEEQLAVAVRLLRQLAKKNPVILWMNNVHRSSTAMVLLQRIRRENRREPMKILLLMTGRRKDPSPHWQELERISGRADSVVIGLTATPHSPSVISEAGMNWLDSATDEQQLRLACALTLGVEVLECQWRRVAKEAGVTGAWKREVASLCKAGILRPTLPARGGGYRFEEEEVKARLEEALGPQRLQQAHAAAMAAFANNVAYGTFERRAVHARASGKVLESVDLFIQAATERLARGDGYGGERILNEREQLLTEQRHPFADQRWGDGWLLLGRCKSQEHKPADAEVWFRRTLDAARKQEWDLLRMKSLWRLGGLARRRGDLQTAWQHLQTAEEVAELTGEPPGALRRDMGVMLAEVGAFDPAASFLREARRSFEEEQDELGSASCFVALAEVSKRAQRYNLALVLLEWARKRYKRMGLRAGVASCLWRIGEIHQLSRRLDQAERFQRMAAELCTRVGATDLAVTELQLGIIRLERREYPAARVALEDLAGHFDEEGRVAWSGYTRACLLPCLAVDSDWKEWDDQLQQAHLQIRKTALVEPNVGRMAFVGGVIAQRRGQGVRALDSFRLAMEQFRAMDNKEMIEQVYLQASG
jgi:tetratricopeptide (TPR) repeat protein